MSDTYSNFRTGPGFYSRQGVVRDRSIDPYFDAFRRSINFCIERFNRGQETMCLDIRTTDERRSRHEATFYLEGRPDLVIKGTVACDLLTIEGHCYDASSRQDFLQLLPRLSRELIEMEMDAAPRP